MRSVATLLVYAWITGYPGGSAQNFAIESCSGVRVSAICRTSASAARNAGDPNAGGDGGRNWLALERKKGRISASRGNTGGAAVNQDPGHTGIGTPPADVKPSLASLVRIRWPIARPIASPAAKLFYAFPGQVGELACAVTSAL